MPCSDGRDSESYLELEVTEANQQVEYLSVALCGALTALGGDLSLIDWVEAGISKDSVQLWWDDHRKADALRKGGK